jgi:hypothetical protein
MLYYFSIRKIRIWEKFHMVDLLESNHMKLNWFAYIMIFLAITDEPVLSYRNVHPPTTFGDVISGCFSISAKLWNRGYNLRQVELYYDFLG